MKRYINKWGVKNITKMIICSMLIAMFFVGCDKNDEPSSNEWEYPQDEPNDDQNKDEDEQPINDPYLIEGLKYKINEDSISCTIIGQEETKIPNHLVLPEKVTILGKSYDVTQIGEYAKIGKKSVWISNSINSIDNQAINSTVVQLIVGSNVKSIYASSGYYSQSYSWDNVKKIIWLTNSEPTIKGGGSIYSLAGDINYMSSNNFYVGGNREVISNLASLFWVNGVLYTLYNPSERTCFAIGYDYVTEEIDIPATIINEGISLQLHDVGKYLFANGDMLRKVTGKYEKITTSMFSGCTALSSVEIGENVLSIGNYAFSNCSALTSLYINKNVTTIGGSAFANCTSLSKIVLGEAINDVGNNAFSNCVSLSNITIEDAFNTLRLGNGGSSLTPLFKDCSLKEVYLGRPISYEISPFQDNTSLESIEITDTETKIYDNEFYGCSNLKNLKIGNGVETIGQYAFSGCYSMESFTVGNGVIKIGKEAFSDCTALTSFTTEAIVPPTCGSQALDDIDKWKCKLYVPDESIEAYKNASQWNNFLFIE